MKIKHSALLGIFLLPVLQACPPGGDECYSNSDCQSGEICNANGECRAAYVAPPRDASYHDLYFLQDHAVEDSAVEDGAVDGGSSDALNPDAQDLDASPDAGAQQVGSFTVCDTPSALALNNDSSELYVACIGDDSLQVYDSVEGQSLRQLNQLSSPCRAIEMELREDFNQLWVSCSADPASVHCVRPDTGRQVLDPFNDSSTAPHSRFASSDDVIAWVSVGGNNFNIQSIDSSSSSSNLLQGAVLGGSDVAVSANNGVTFFLQTNSQDNAIRRFDSQGGILTDIYAIVAQPQLIVAASVNSASLNRPLLIAGTQQYARLGEDGVNMGNFESVSSGFITTAVSRSDGGAYFMGVSDLAQSASWIYEISSDPLSTSAFVSKQEIPGCNISALAAASDGRVFAACSDTNHVFVKYF